MNEGPFTEEDAPWTGCVHCGQTLPHQGTGWRESSRCRLFQRIAEQAWEEGANAAVEPYNAGTHMSLRARIPFPADENPYSVTPPEEGKPVQGCMACATYRHEGRACPTHRRVTPPGNGDTEERA